jgi:hypothetical protein
LAGRARGRGQEYVEERDLRDIGRLVQTCLTGFSLFIWFIALQIALQIVSDSFRDSSKGHDPNCTHHMQDSQTAYSIG